MPNRGIEFSVGIFFLLGLLSLAYLAIKVSGLSPSFEDERGFLVTADFSNVSNLKSRARVTCAGVVVGRVVSIDFNKSNYAARVTLRLQGDVDNMPDDSKASILTAGFLGDNYIGLAPGFSDTPFKAGDHIVLENTTSGVVLEDLISRFVASGATEKKGHTQ